MIATTLFAIDVVPLVAAAGFFTVKPFGGHAPIKNQGRYPLAQVLKRYGPPEYWGIGTLSL
jgi:hypothetical protein